jgi:hypothetical protein
MSFAATAALIAVFNALRGAEWWRTDAALAKPLIGVSVTSLVAGACDGALCRGAFQPRRATG